MIHRVISIGIFLSVLCHISVGLPEISQSVGDLVTSWAPVIWLHSAERFYPSSIEFHFNHTELRDDNETVIQQFPTRYDVETGNKTNLYHLNSVPDLDCPDCYLDWFAGQNLEDVPIYAYVREYNDTCNTIDIAYRAFYPFNFGKDVCLGPEIGGFCTTGNYETFGNHVGDWEHYSVRFLNNQISSAVINYHGFVVNYVWDDDLNVFTLYNGTNSPLISGEYPQYLTFYQDNHAQVFSANGSHGVWAGEGEFEYIHAPSFSLVDACEKGVAWETWNMMEIIPYEENYTYDEEYTYIEYQGKWGNLEDGCGLIAEATGECTLMNGPTHYFPFPSDDFIISCNN